MRACAIVARLRTLPALDASVTRLAGLVQDPNSTIESFEKVIRADPALTVNLLKLANSAMYGGRATVVSVHDAITRVGTRRVWEVASAGAFGKVMPKELPGYDIDAVGFWRHSVAVALLSESIARTVRLPNAGDAFTAGLLHDMGKLVIEGFLAEKRAELLDRLEAQNLSMIHAERELLGTDHAVVGLAVAERWRLPAVLGAATRWHHDPSGAPDPAQRDMAGVVHIANGLAHAMGFGSDIAGLRRGIDPSILARFSLAPETMERIASQALAGILEMGRSLMSPAATA